jgi:hypothetical protein
MLSRAALKQARYRERQTEPVRLVLKIEAEWGGWPKFFVGRIADRPTAFSRLKIQCETSNPS